ncbi:hypothetical protein J0H58_30705 [bacterium]|nr:hypothetical protein [bacterium]
MFKFTHGSPDEMQVWIACAIVTYLIVFPLVVVFAAVLAEVLYRVRSDGPNAVTTSDETPAPGPVHQRGVVASAPSEPGVGTAA